MSLYLLVALGALVDLLMEGCALAAVRTLSGAVADGVSTVTSHARRGSGLHEGLTDVLMLLCQA